MSAFQGLKACGNHFNDFCITKSIQFALSFLLFAATFYQLCSRLKRQRQINFFFVVSFQIQVSLLCNMLFCWFHKSYFLYDIEVFAFSLYFTTIVYQVALRLVEKAINLKKIYWAVIHGVFLLYIVANIVFFILKFTNSQTSQFCSQNWVLVLQSFGIFLSICMVIGGKKYEKIQKQKVSAIYKNQHLKNPMPSMWKWITVNILCQILGLIESLYLQFSPSHKCIFSQNSIVQSSLNLFFDIFSYHLAMFATFWFLKQKFKEAEIVKRNSLRKDSGGQQTNNIQLVISRFSQLQ